MKKIYAILISFITIGACSQMAFAQSTFTPLNFDGATYTSTKSSDSLIASSATSNTTSAQVKNTVVSDTTGSKNMQSAITQLDNAQVEVRNELLNYKTKYSEVDAKYTTIKTERADLAKQVRACERKIRQLDKAKEKIRKNMI